MSLINNSPEAILERKRSALWRSAKLFSSIGFNPDCEAAQSADSMRVTDYYAVRERASVRVQQGSDRPVRVDITFKPLAPEAWNNLLQLLATEALPLAGIHRGELRAETEERATEAAMSLFPANSSDISLLVNDEPADITSPFVASAILRLGEQLDAEPLLIFLLRGKDKEEITHTLQVKRAALKEGLSTFDDAPALLPPPVSHSSNRSFYQSGPELSSLSYSLRADELPASLLRRLNPIPLDGLEDDIEPLLEEAYAQIARRAQAFGFGLG